MSKPEPTAPEEAEDDRSLDELLAELPNDATSDEDVAVAEDNEALDKLLAEFGVGADDVPEHEVEQPVDQPEASPEPTASEPDVMNLDADAFRKLQLKYGYVTN